MPTLLPGQDVVLVNLSVHKIARAYHLIEAAGAEVWFLLLYSPYRTPIELALSTLEGRLRRSEARTFAEMVTAIGTSYSAITA